MKPSPGVLWHVLYYKNHKRREAIMCLWFEKLFSWHWLIELAAKLWDESPERERMCVCMCVSIYECTYVHMCECIYVYISSRAWVYTCIWTDVFSCEYVYVHMWCVVCMRVCMHICMFVWSCVRRKSTERINMSFYGRGDLIALTDKLLSYLNVRMVSSLEFQGELPWSGRIPLHVEALRVKLPGLLKIGCLQVGLSFTGFLSTPRRFVPKHISLVNQHWTRAISYGKHKNLCFQ